MRTIGLLLAILPVLLPTRTVGSRVEPPVDAANMATRSTGTDHGHGLEITPRALLPNLQALQHGEGSKLARLARRSSGSPYYHAGPWQPVIPTTPTPPTTPNPPNPGRGGGPGPGPGPGRGGPPKRRTLPLEASQQQGEGSEPARLTRRESFSHPGGAPTYYDAPLMEVKPNPQA